MIRSDTLGSKVFWMNFQCFSNFSWGGVEASWQSQLQRLVLCPGQSIQS